MSKSLWISGLAVVLLGIAAARAEDKPEALKPESAKVEVRAGGPVRVEVQGEVKAAPGQVERIRKVWVYGQAVEAPKTITVEKPGMIVLEGTIQLGDYWLGVAVGRPDDALRSKLTLPEEQGLVVRSVVPDSPAAKAGVKEDDVLLKAGEKPLKDVKDLIDVVNETKGKELVIELLRDGKPEKLTITPAKRPAETRGAAALQGNADWDKISKWIGQLQFGMEGEGREGQPLRFHIFRPGAILPPTALLQHPLPEDMTVTITKTGKKAAQITVKQGETSWEVTEEQLDKLPEKVRTHVERLLGRMPFNIRVLEPGEAIQPGQPPLMRPRAVPAPADGRLEKRLDEMNQQIEKLSQMIDDLRQKAKEKEN